jgi:hypothetical protein
MAHESDGPRKGEVKFENGRAYFDTDDEEENEDDE